MGILGDKKEEGMIKGFCSDCVKKGVKSAHNKNGS